MPQSLAQLYIHMVTSTKNREPWIDPAWQNELYQVLGAACRETKCHSLIVGGMPDHIHILFSLARTTAVSEAVNRIKSSSSAWVKQTRKLSHQFHWQNGYGAFTVSQSNVDAVRKYILNQEEHHSGRTFQEEYRELLERHHIEWDERYVWD